MKKIILMVLAFLQILIADKIYLSEYISLVSQVSNKSFVLSEEVDSTFTLDISIEDLKKNDYFLILKDLLNTNDLKIINKGKYYFIKPIDEKKEEKLNLQYLKLNYIDYSDIESFFKVDKDSNIIYIPNDKTILYYSTDSSHKRLKSIISKIDKLPSQLKLKITVIDTNLDKLKEFGTEISQEISFNSNFFFNLLAFPLNINTELTSSQTYSLSGYIKMLNSKDISSSISSPTITLYDNKSTSFSTGKNISYSSGSTTVSDGSSTTTDTTSYRDVGFSIKVLPKIYENYAVLDLNIVNESLLDSSDTPTTSKISLTQTLRIEKNKSLILTGINQTQNISSISSVPVLSKIPFMDWLFKYENDNFIDSNLTLILELVDSSNVDNSELKNLSIPILKEKEDLTDHQRHVNELLGLE